MSACCIHPITFDEPRRGHHPADMLKFYWWRECAMCGFGYDRSSRVLELLAAHCWNAWRVDFGRVSAAIRDEGEWRHEEFVP